MLKTLLKLKEDVRPHNQLGPGFVYDPYRPHKPDLRMVEKCFARLFSSEDGKMALAHLQTITFHRALGPASPDEQLRHLEGQRAIVATILRLIDRGRNN